MGCLNEQDPLLPDTTNKLTLARGWTAVVTLVISLAMFLFAGCNIGRKYKRYKLEWCCCGLYLIHFFGNPFFLLAFISMLPVIVYGSVIIRYPSYQAYGTAGYNASHLDDSFCELPGYFLVWFESAETMALTVFSLYFLFYLRFRKKDSSMKIHSEYVPIRRNADENTQYISRVPKPGSKYYLHSTLSVIVALVILIVCEIYTGPPYFVESSDSTGYGDIGPWCWIKPEQAQKNFWFYEEWTYMFISSVLLLVGLVFACCIVRNPQKKYRPFPSIWWDTTVLVPFSIFLVYFILQSGLLIIEILVRLCRNSDQALWYTYAIGKPLSKIFLIIASLQLMSISYRMGNKNEGIPGANNYGAVQTT